MPFEFTKFQSNITGKLLDFNINIDNFRRNSALTLIAVDGLQAYEYDYNLADEPVLRLTYQLVDPSDAPYKMITDFEFSGEFFTFTAQLDDHMH